MKNPLFFIIFITSLFISSCSKPDVVEPKIIHPLEQFIGKWVPYELINNGNSYFGPFLAITLFGPYNDSFEVIDTSGIYYPSSYSVDSLGNQYFKRSLANGKIIVDEKTKSLSLVYLNITWEPSNFEFKSDKELWLYYTNFNGILKLKKI